MTAESVLVPSSPEFTADTPDTPILNVFISSKMHELAAERKALYDLLPTLGQGLATIRPWVFEYSAEASDRSIRATYLQKLETAALYIGLFWNEYGEWTIDEFEQATQNHIDRHIYVKDVDSYKRSAKLNAFLKKHGDVTSGLTAKWFTTIDELCEAVIHSIESWLRDVLSGRRGIQRATLINQNNSDLLRDQGPTRFIGRGKLVGAIQDALDRGQNVLLQGFGGMGKTTLAARVALNWLQAEKGSVIWLHAGTENADSLFDALASAFDGQSKYGNHADKVSVLRQLLAESGAKLLVLDNAWNDKALARVMEAIPHGMVALVTSRSRYPLNNGEIIAVGQLTMDEAIDLVSYHAQHSYRSDAGAHELCQHLGNHPLALEIAGKTLLVDEITPSELLARIAAAPHEMKLPFGFAKDNRESVASLIQVSLKAVSDDAHTVFLAFGPLFAPSATPTLLAHYKKLPENRVEAALTELRRRGLAERVAATDDNALYYRVHDLAFSYAKAASKKAKRQAVIAACRDYARVHQTDVAALQAELNNLLGAAELARDLNQDEALIDIMYALTVDGSYFTARGYTRLAMDLVEAAIAAAKALGDKIRAHYLLSKLGNAYTNFWGDFDRALFAYQEARELAHELHNASREAILLSVIGTVRFRQMADDAEDYFERAYKLASEHHADDALGTILSHRGYYAMKRDSPDYESARRFADEAVQVAIRLGLDELHYSALLNRGGCEYELKLFDQALATHHEVYEFAQEKGNHMWMGQAMRSMGEDYEGLGNREEAQRCFDEALALWDNNEAAVHTREVITYMKTHHYTVRSSS